MVPSSLVWRRRYRLEARSHSKPRPWIGGQSFHSSWVQIIVEPIFTSPTDHPGNFFNHTFFIKWKFLKLNCKCRIQRSSSNRRKFRAEIKIMDSIMAKVNLKQSRCESHGSTTAVSLIEVLLTTRLLVSPSCLRCVHNIGLSPQQTVSSSTCKES